MCGLLKGCNRYATISNRESGNGRPDIVLAYPSARGPVIILELKVAKRFQELEAGCDAALEQIEQQNYAAYWENEGYTSITKYGICFIKRVHGKEIFTLKRSPHDQQNLTFYHQTVMLPQRRIFAAQLADALENAGYQCELCEIPEDGIAGEMYEQAVPAKIRRERYRRRQQPCWSVILERNMRRSLTLIPSCRG